MSSDTPRSHLNITFYMTAILALLAVPLWGQSGQNIIADNATITRSFCFGEGCPRDCGIPVNDLRICDDEPVLRFYSELVNTCTLQCTDAVFRASSPFEIFNEGAQSLLNIQTYADSASSAGNLRFDSAGGTEALPTDLSVGDEIGSLMFRGLQNGSVKRSARIQVHTATGYDTSGNDSPGIFDFQTVPDESITLVSRLKLSGAETRFNDAGADVDFVVESSTSASGIYFDAGNTQLGIGGAPSEALHIVGGASQVKLAITGTGGFTGFEVDNATAANGPWAFSHGNGGAFAIVDSDATDGIGGSQELRITNSGDVRASGYFGAGGVVPATLFDGDEGTGRGIMTLDGSTGGCLKIRDTDDAGWTYCVVLNGTMTCSTSAC